MTCKDCEHARKAYVEGKVGCGLISKAKHFGIIPTQAKCPHCGEPLGEVASFDQFLDSIKFTKDEVYEGWSNLGLRPESTSREGMMTNECYILDEDNGCNYFEVRK